MENSEPFVYKSKFTDRKTEPEVIKEDIKSVSEYLDSLSKPKDGPRKSRKRT